MPLIQLPHLWIVFVNIAAWTFFHLFISLVCLNISRDFFFRNHPLFGIYGWEKEGKIWDNLFRVKAWKGRLIDGSSVLGKGYTKKKLHGTTPDDLRIFAAETKRAEFTHWLCIWPAPLFFLWNPQWAGWIMVLYALLFNLPFIIVQRYNRGRINRLLIIANRAEG